jgi:hypothetical protein
MLAFAALFDLSLTFGENNCKKLNYRCQFLPRQNIDNYDGFYFVSI